MNGGIYGLKYYFISAFGYVFVLVQLLFRNIFMVYPAKMPRLTALALDRAVERSCMYVDVETLRHWDMMDVFQRGSLWYCILRVAKVNPVKIVCTKYLTKQNGVRTVVKFSTWWALWLMLSTTLTHHWRTAVTSMFVWSYNRCGRESRLS